MKINNVEYDIDFTDADFIERMDEGIKKVQEKVKTFKNEDLSVAEGIRQECKIIKDFFDYVLGEGASKEIFGEKNSLNLCIKAFEDIVEAKEQQLKSFKEKINKYSPDRLMR